MNMTSKNSKQSDVQTQTDSYNFRCTSKRYDSIIDPNVPSIIRVLVPTKVIKAEMYSGPRFQFITGGVTQTTWFNKNHAETLIGWLNKAKAIISTYDKSKPAGTNPLSSIIISGVKFVLTGSGEIVAHNKSGRVAIAGYKTTANKDKTVTKACDCIILILSDFVSGVYSSRHMASSDTTKTYIVDNPSDYYGVTYVRYSNTKNVPFVHICSNSNGMMSMKFDNSTPLELKCNLEHVEKLYESVSAMAERHPFIAPGSRYISESQGVIRYITVFNPPNTNRWLLSISSDSISFASKAVMTISMELLTNLKRILSSTITDIKADISNG